MSIKMPRVVDRTSDCNSAAFALAFSWTFDNRSLCISNRDLEDSFDREETSWDNRSLSF